MQKMTIIRILYDIMFATLSDCMVSRGSKELVKKAGLLYLTLTFFKKLKVVLFV